MGFAGTLGMLDGVHVVEILRIQWPLGGSASPALCVDYALVFFENSALEPVMALHAFGEPECVGANPSGAKTFRGSWDLAGHAGWYLRMAWSTGQMAHLALAASVSQSAGPALAGPSSHETLRIFGKVYK